MSLLPGTVQLLVRTSHQDEEATKRKQQQTTENTVALMFSRTTNIKLFPVESKGGSDQFSWSISTLYISQLVSKSWRVVMSHNSLLVDIATDGRLIEGTMHV